jgi:hypothetical protein
MAKWADYLISEVRYVVTVATRHIASVKVHEDKGEQVGGSTVWTRKDVINAIDLKTTFFTITKTEKGEWKKGAAVEKIQISNEWYIKTERDNTKKDNLENLPEF